MQRHRNKSIGCKSGGRAGQATCPELIISVSVLHQSSWKFCTYLLLSFAAASLFTFCIRSWEGASLPVCVRYQMFCNVQSCQVQIVAGVHHSGLTCFSAETVQKIYVVVFIICEVLRILTTTELQHNTGTLAYAV
jgi:hypothetical protein